VGEAFRNSCTYDRGRRANNDAVFFKDGGFLMIHFQDEKWKSPFQKPGKRAANRHDESACSMCAEIEVPIIMQVGA
jgi:hypothetical protein